MHTLGTSFIHWLKLTLSEKSNCSTTARNTVLKGPQHGRKILLHFICITTTRPVASIHIPLVICTLQCAHLYIQPLYILVTPTYISVILTKCSISEQIKKVGGGCMHGTHIMLCILDHHTLTIAKVICIQASLSYQPNEFKVVICQTILLVFVNSFCYIDGIQSSATTSQAHFFMPNYNDWCGGVIHLLLQSPSLQLLLLSLSHLYICPLRSNTSFSMLLATEES